MSSAGANIGKAVEQPAAAPVMLVLKPRPKHGFFFIVQWLGGVLVIAIFVMTFIVQAFEIPSESMENTLLIGDYLLVDKVDYAQDGFWGHTLPYSQIKRGDIVVFRFPVQPTQHFVKRVIGIPGDHIRLSNKQVWVNGTLVHEDYTVFRSTTHDGYRDDFPDLSYYSGNIETHWYQQLRKSIHNGDLVVPAGQYFVLGDNRDESLDSRYWGFVPAENIVGRPLLIYWSVGREDPDQANAQPRGGKLSRAILAVRRVFSDMRWKRTMTIVR